MTKGLMLAVAVYALWEGALHGQEMYILPSNQDSPRKLTIIVATHAPIILIPKE